MDVLQTEITGGQLVTIITVVFIVVVTLVMLYLKDKVLTNKKFKPMAVKEAEQLVANLIRQRYGRKKNYLEVFLNEFMEEFPDWQTRTKKHLKMCINPNNERKNPDLLEDILKFFEKVYIVEGSTAFKTM